jgi:hypothetical protein
VESAAAHPFFIFLKNRASLLAWCLVALVSVWHMCFIRLEGDHWKTVIASDGAGYYAYLPASFIYHDFHYNFCLPGHPTNPGYYGSDRSLFMARTAEGKLVNKYLFGTTVLMSPFFLLAHGIAFISGQPHDGYSFIYQLFLCLAGIFYLLAGMSCLRSLLQRAGLKEFPIAVTLLLLFFGTNLYHYALEEPTMSHVYSFAAIAFFLLKSHDFLREPTNRNLLYAGITLLLIAFIRPTNMIVLLAVPLLRFPNESCPAVTFRRDYLKPLVLIIFTGLLLLFLQFLCYRLSLEEWTLAAYPGETFDFLHPHLIDVLFSWRKGLFIYTPLLLVAVAGLFFIPGKKNTRWLVLFLLVNLWIISSWHDWSYGGSLGMRPFIDSYSLLAIPLAFLVQACRARIAQLALGATLGFFVFLNMVQHYQYREGILPVDNMTWRKYRLIFMQTEKFYQGIFYYEPGRLPDKVSFLKAYHLYFEHDSLPASNYGVSSQGKCLTPPNAVFMHDTIRNTPDISVDFKGTVPDQVFRRTWVKAKIHLWLTSMAGRPKLIFIFSDNGVKYAREEWLINLPTGSWQEYESAMKLPVPKSEKGRVSVYLAKEDGSPAYADNLELSFWVEEQER